ncbi:DUF4192 domain-containing protein [Streptomyces sp. NPDC020141]|uniref:DUF4192 domain-containing protein n=1 Tax=Streptomyces sp. NPDC020141 TaxID=3365065 RepID=UPI003790FFE0
MNKHQETSGPADEPQITLRGPAELADALPYVLGYHPTDSVVMVALHGSRGRFGGRVRIGIPRSEKEWSPVARQLAECLIEGSERRAARPDGIVLFLCQDPADGESGLRVMERLRPLAQWLRTACGALDVPVYEALCVSGGRFWSYCCPDRRCCPAEGTALAVPGTSVMAATAAYAGVSVRGSLRDMEARLVPPAAALGTGQQRALDRAAGALAPRILDGDRRAGVARETIELARALMERIAQAPPSAGRTAAQEDLADDRLISHDEAAAVIVGLQDRETRDRAAEWMEGAEAGPALRLWRALCRRCVGPYTEHAAAPLTLAGWVSWSTGDEPAARVALGLALDRDPEYVFARLLHQACNEDLDPETLRDCLRVEREAREALASVPAPAVRSRGAGRPPAPRGTAARRSRPGARPAGAGKPRGTAGPRPGGTTGGPGRTGGRRAQEDAGRGGAREEREGLG